ncbi:hypothetical protein E2562_024585 [Oryza meyeriana var. granulata]|uniref:Uncharacterized protein n=1 Tax=Oryza meyeriana var. granulata TaxID=110450 RepID=A0A6G1CSQ9_9ORYZ|nr:hypothetical protein E2562_024585 [Oryza meyeriana var. granulata]
MAKRLVWGFCSSVGPRRAGMHDEVARGIDAMRMRFPGERNTRKSKRGSSRGAAAFKGLVELGRGDGELGEERMGVAMSWRAARTWRVGHGVT